jgi:hypothetical protein
MGEVQVSLVKYDNFARLDPHAEFPGAFGVVVPGGVHDGEARQNTLEVQPQMTVGGGLARAAARSVHARSNQRNGSRVHQMNRAAESPGKAPARLTADKARRETAQVIQHRTEELLGHCGRADFVGVGKIVTGGRRGSAQTGERSRMQVKGVTHIIEAHAMGELRIEQGNHVTPSAEGADIFVHAGFTGESGNEKNGNEVANLRATDSASTALERLCFSFSSLPCGRAKQTVTAFSSIPMGWL